LPFGYHLSTLKLPRKPHFLPLSPRAPVDKTCPDLVPQGRRRAGCPLGRCLGGFGERQ